MSTSVTESPRKPLAIGRALSLLLACPMALLLLIHPGLMVDGAGHYSHSLLMLVMWGVSAGLVHGVGFVPRLRVWRIAFGPAVAWILCALGYAILLRAQMAL